MTKIDRPAKLSINAWTGAKAPVQDLPAQTPWATRENLIPYRQFLAAPDEPDERDWMHPDVGWGLVLRDNDSISIPDRVVGADAPEPLRQLLQKRAGAPVLRWRPELQQNYLRRYYADGLGQDLSTAAVSVGVGRGCIPRYLLIYATPKDIPWAVQYALNASCYVGRLDLVGDSLAHYVNALINDWAEQDSDPRAPLVWSAVHDQTDITYLMSGAVCEKVWRNLDANDDLIGRRWINGGDATILNLANALAEKKPALIVTTSHGMTGPLHDGALMSAQLGAPVDIDYATLDAQLLAAWSPSGAIWYSNACCAAGADSKSRYEDLMPADGDVGALLRGVAKGAGAMISPLPRYLLGHERPLRAFVGHVEPTFDWTLQDPDTKQITTMALSGALTTRLYRRYERNPVGWALHKVYEEAGHFFAGFQQAIKDVNSWVPGAPDSALYRQLSAMDRQTTVILGDPTVSMPKVA